MNIDLLRKKYRELKSGLNEQHSKNWRFLEEKLKKLDPQPLPAEWVNILNTYANECKLECEIQYWKENRLRNENGWGDNPLPQTDIEGWDDYLPAWKKLNLVKRQINQDIQTELSYEQWEHDFNERN